MNLREIFKTAASTTGLVVISGLAAAHGHAGMAMGAAAVASMTGALAGIQLQTYVNK